MPPDAPGKVLTLAAVPPTAAGDLAVFLRELADRAEQGRVLGFALVCELPGAEVSTSFHVHDMQRLLGGIAQLQHRLLTRP